MDRTSEVGTTLLTLNHRHIGQDEENINKRTIRNEYVHLQRSVGENQIGNQTGFVKSINIVPDEGHQLVISLSHVWLTPPRSPP